MNTIRLVVAVVITAVWAAVVLQSVLSGVSGGALTAVSPVMLLVATFLFGQGVIQRLRNGDNKNGGTS
jgi:high-affinity Fe2+/Pb2+ permease